MDPAVAAAGVGGVATVLAAVLGGVRRNSRQHDVTDRKLDAIGHVVSDTRETVARIDGTVTQIDGRVTRLEVTKEVGT